MRLIDADALKIAIDDGWMPDMMVSEIWGVIDEVPTVGGWISVKDRMPEKDEDVIIYGFYVGQSGEIYPITVISDIKEFKWRECTPIAWMPLPEPPKEG